MFGKKDIRSCLYLLAVLIATLITLGQVLIIYRYGRHKSYSMADIRRRTKDQSRLNTNEDVNVMTKSKNLNYLKILARQDMAKRYIREMINDKPQEHVARRWLPKNKLSNGTFTEDCKRFHGDENGENISSYEKNVKSGGYYRPRCYTEDTLAVIIPYRDRFHHLQTLLASLLPLLIEQNIEFMIFVVEQEGTATFNKGRLMNAGFLEARKLFSFRCVVFHDVDLVPETLLVPYACPQYPTHLSVAIDTMNYRLIYDLLVGGVLLMQTEHFRMVNGYSNEYWGWGAEDDDMAYRLILSGLRITRPPEQVARYKMLFHKKRHPSSWKKRSKLLKTVYVRFQRDGISDVKYRVISLRKMPLYTHILLNVGKQP